MTEAISIQGGVLALLLGVLAGSLVGAAYFAALRWSVRRIEQGAAFFAIGAIVRLAMITAVVSVATIIDVGAAALLGAAFGFLLARHAAIALCLRNWRAQP